MQQYYEPPSSEEDDAAGELGEPATGVPSLQKSTFKCPFCLREKKNGESHILRCYIKACRKSSKYPLCTCPDHIGVLTHSPPSRPSKSPRFTNQEQASEIQSNLSSLHSPPFNDLDSNFINGDSGLFSQHSGEENSQINQQNQTQGEYATQFELGKSKICLGKMLPGLHSCSRSITASNVKIVIINKENDEEYYICSLSVLSSTMERNNLHNFYNDRINDDVQVQEDDLLSGCCARKNCNKEKCRKDLLLKKPVSTSQKTDQNSSIKFCSLDHMMLYLANLSENKWNRRILVRNGNTTIESSNGMCCLNNQY